MSTNEEHQAALVPAQSTALTKAGAKSLAARGRTDLRIREEAEEWLRKGLEFSRQGSADTHASAESALQIVNAEVASGRCSRDEQLVLYDKHFLRDPGHRWEQAVACFERGLELSPTHSELQFRLGEAYFNEMGVPRDYEEAAMWFSKAANSGYAQAQFYLGWMCAGFFASGSGVPTDYVQATFWWRKGAEQGHADSQHYLGEFYACGFGVEQNYAQAAYWIRKAAEQVRDDEPKRFRLYSDLASWLMSTAEQGVIDAQYLLGWLYYHGRDIPQDYVQTANWYRKAAEQGDTMAQSFLDMLYQRGQVASRDPEQAPI